jgi:hypothetical protein
MNQVVYEQGLAWEFFFFYTFVYLANELNSNSSLGSTIKQVKFKYYNMFVNKIINIKLDLYTCINTYLYRFEIELCSYIKKVHKISNYYL